MNKYKDPHNKQEILERIRNCPTLGDIYSLVKEIFPTWIKSFVQEYSHDYPHLQSNWKINAEKLDIKTAQIMIVEYIGVSDEYSLTNVFAEIFTLSGFIVRSEDEIEVCEICNRAIPGKAQYQEMKKRGLQVPFEWSSKCVTC